MSRINWKPKYKIIQNMYKNGMSTVDIAKKYKTNKTIIRRIILNKTKLRSPKQAQALKEKYSKVISHKSQYKIIQKMYKNGMSPNEISKKIFIKQRVIESILNRTIGLRSKSEAMKLAALKGRIPTLIKKGDVGYKSIKWVKDRSKIKWDRGRTEEIWFFKEVLKERNYTCELTGKRGGKLSVHHRIPVWKNKKLRYSKLNVIVITKNIHKQFHFLYGFKADEIDWDTFINEQQYYI